ncbi:MAG: hypothetical protein GXY80_06100 [Syntrophorhabdus aromaticivorans]|uniref:Uncharacterized protein n=1 Tax=Syntrophorhabdus aromaticivorans TaxID=328301 RepID=A0A971S0F9_9BACT|nr:hypothetical protein [Syntrophorhabdus aromaticivorans]
MDLLYDLLPECRRFIEPLADIRLITKGYRIPLENFFHPFLRFSADGYTAHYYLDHKGKSADRFRGLLNEPDEVSLLEVRFEDAVLDSWKRQCSLSVENCTLWDCPSLRREYDILLAQTKNILKYDDVTFLKACARIATSIQEACMKFHYLAGLTD